MKWLIPPVLLTASAVVMLVIYRMVASAGLLPEPLNYVLGIPLMAAGLGLAAAGSRQFRKVKTNIHTFRVPEVLVRDGLFAFSRNPMYLGFSLALLGFALKLNDPINFAVVAGFVVIVDLWYIRYEERVAREVFGGAYEEYCRETRRWI